MFGNDNTSAILLFMRRILRTDGKIPPLNPTRKFAQHLHHCMSEGRLFVQMYGIRYYLLPAPMQDNFY